jgi:hypothetical protein
MSAIYWLIESNSPKVIEEAFKILDVCFSLRNTIFGLNNYQNFLTCSEIIFKFHSKCYDKI